MKYLESKIKKRIVIQYAKMYQKEIQNIKIKYKQMEKHLQSTQKPSSKMLLL